MTSFDPTKFQVSHNGPLTQQVIKRLVAIKQRSGMSYAALAKELGFSSTFVHHLINKNVNIGTQHVKRVVAVIENLENPNKDSNLTPTVNSILRHSYHLRSDLQISFDLPDDLTNHEADRLAKFVQSLPVC